ncbi:hypothetical protein quinque_005059 [Culex quinquefasciatus]
MWFTGFTIVSTVFLASNALPTLVQFRSPSFVDPAPVSLFYADEYLLDARASTRFVYIPALLREQPCLLMEPAYSFVRDHMALYGTCDYQDVFWLDLQRSGKQWTAKVKHASLHVMTTLVALGKLFDQETSANSGPNFVRFKVDTNRSEEFVEEDQVVVAE